MRVRLFGLQPGQEYAVQLRSNNGEAVSSWSQRFKFNASEDMTIPKTPTGFTWVNNETVSFFGEWNAVTENEDDSTLKDFSYYELYMESGDGDVVTVKTKDTKYTLTLSANSDFFAPPGDPPAHTVKAKVRTVDIYGNHSDYTDLIIVQNMRPIPVNDNGVGNGIMNATGIPDAIRVIWNAPTGAEKDFDHYSVHMVRDDYDDGMGHGPTNFLPLDENKQWEGNATSFVHQSTVYDHDFYFQVVRWDVFGQNSLGNARDHDAPLHGARHGDPPDGTAGGDLTGTYPNPSIAPQAVTASKIANHTITDNEVAAANIDGTAATASMRTLGTGAHQAAAGNDPRFSMGGGGGTGGIDIDCGGPSDSLGIDIECGVVS